MKQVIVTVCWKCKYGNRTLYNVKDEIGRKSNDYVCLSCIGLGYRKPPIGNSSFVKENRLEAKDIKLMKEENDKTK